MYGPKIVVRCKISGIYPDHLETSLTGEIDLSLQEVSNKEILIIPLGKLFKFPQ